MKNKSIVVELKNIKREFKEHKIEKIVFFEVNGNYADMHKTRRIVPTTVRLPVFLQC